MLLTGIARSVENATERARKALEDKAMPKAMEERRRNRPPRGKPQKPAPED